MPATLTTPADPQALVGRWIRLERDEGRPAHVGRLTRCEAGDRPGLWHWTLTTPSGRMIGGGGLPAEALTREHKNDLARTRRQITVRLKSDQSLLAALLAEGEPVGQVARMVTLLEDLQQSLATEIR